MNSVPAVTLWQLWLIFLKLGCSSFGGPVAHLAYFRHEFVQQRRWYTEQEYAELVALCQFLPGPASSQVGIGIGYYVRGYRGALLSWLGFTLPSAILMALFAASYLWLGQNSNPSWLTALKIVAVAVVAQAVWSMAKTLCPDRARASIALLSAILMLVYSGALVQLVVIVLASVAGMLFLPPAAARDADNIARPALTRAQKWRAIGCLLLFFLLLFALPYVAELTDNAQLRLFDAFYRAGALVFGGGHVVLPLLQAQLVPAGWLSNDSFLAGYGAAQALPGPLFTFATYLGAISAPVAWQGAILATLAIFLPAFLLVFALLPWWQQLRHFSLLQRSIAAVNAAVVGILLAALYQPVFSSVVTQASDMALVLLAFIALVVWKLPPYLVVLAAACGAIMFSQWA